MICQDPRLEPSEYERPITVNYICTNPSDFKAQKDHLIEITKRLEICQKTPRKCQ